MKYYYLINNRIMSANEKMPEINEQWHNYNSNLLKWSESLQPCEISESELDKIKLNVGLESYNTPIEVTDIVESDTKWSKEQDCVIDIVKFKQPKQVEEIEAVEFAEWLNNNCATDGDNAWRYYQKGGSLFTTKQLYEIFKNQK